jgi:hypothetical protein
MSKPSKRETALAAILNSADFNSVEWKNASEELYAIRRAKLEANPVKVPANWCESDGKWWT